jgi:hypothetical protein
VAVSARYDAMTAASGRFASAAVTLADIERAVQRACGLAAGATGDAGAAGEVVRFCDRATGAMDDTCTHLLEVAGGLRRALEVMWAAAGGGDDLADDPVRERPGGPR